MANKIKHLEFIQGIINRLSQNSFLLKGWSVLLVSALFALAGGSGTAKQWLVLVPYVPAIVFWGLDAYFLWQERLYRALYDHVRGLDEDTVDFAMDVSQVEGKVAKWWQVIFSKTLLLFHGVIVVAITMVAINI